MRDYFVSSNAWYWVIQIISPIYYLALLAYTILLLDVVIPDTYCAVYPCGTYFSLRFHSLEWIGVSFTAIRVWLFPLFCFAVIWRRDFGCSVFWFIFFTICVLVDVFGFLTLSRLFASCNGLNQPYNICNDVNYCCAAEIWTVSANGCKNTGPCPSGFPTVLSQMSSNPTFVWIWATSIPFVLLEVLALTFIAVMNFALSSGRRRKSKQQQQQETDQFSPSSKMTKGE